MDSLLHFLSTLILLTAGLVVVVLWIIISAIVAVEIWDLIRGNNQEDDQ